MSVAVHQLLPVLSPGDAIGSAVQGTRSLLRELGFRSEIFAELIDQRLSSTARPASELEAALGPGDAVMYHLSIGSRMARLVERTRARRVIVYHNITPTHYYRRTSPTVTYWLDRGRDDLRRLAPLTDLAIAYSAYSLDEVAACGARTCVVVPPPIDLGRLHPRPAVASDPPALLFVGRIAPNKRPDDLLRVLAAVRATSAPEARLELVGNSNDTSAYAAGLRRLAERLGVDGAAVIPQRGVGNHELAGIYARASVFVCASEHEGFCMPIIEAMAFSVPVVAYAAAAVPETLGGAGALLTSRDPLAWAGVISRVIGDTALRSTMIDLGRRRLDEYDHTSVRRRLGAALSLAGVEP